MPILTLDDARQASLAKSLGVESLAVPEKELAKWTAVANDLLDKSKQGAALTAFNTAVQPVTFLTGNAPSMSDLTVLGAAHDALALLAEPARLKVVSACRWYDHIQHLPGVASLGLSVIAFDRNAPLQAAAVNPEEEAKRAAQRAKKEAKKKEKEAEKAKRKAEGGGGGKGKGKGGAIPDQPPASMLDIRVGKIVKAWKHPEADSLYVEEIDVGEAEPRTVVSGLVKFIPEADMQNRDVVVLCNLKPSAMRGIKSYAMVLCCTSPDGAKVEFVTPPAGAKPGDRVTFPGMEGFEPLPQLPPKKKIFEAVQPDFSTTAEKVAQYKDLPFTTTSGVCTVATVAGGSIK